MAWPELLTRFSRRERAASRASRAEAADRERLGVDVRQNYRPFKPQSPLKVNHVHFHVLPRSEGDYLYKVSERFEADLFADLDDLERDEVAKLLK